MKKIVYITTFLLLSFKIVSSQQKIVIEGQINDSKSNSAISFVNIYIQNKPVGTISNSNGIFSFTFDGAINDTIVFSHLNYEKRKIPVIQLTEKNSKITLIQKSFDVDEVTVTTSSIPEIVNNAVGNSVKKLRGNFPMLLQAYYREFVNENGQYTKFADGILDYHIGEKSKGIKTTIRVNQSRAKEMPQKNETKIDWDLTSPLDVREVPIFKALNKLEQVFGKDNAPYYNFKLFSDTADDDTETLLIRFEPKSKIEKPLYSGKIEIDRSRNLILSFEYILSPENAEFSKEINLVLLKSKLLQGEVKVLFNAIGADYYPRYIKRYVKMSVWNKKKIDETFSFLSDFLCTKVMATKTTLFIPKKEAYNKKALYSLGNNYDYSFWKEQNVIPLTPEEEEIIHKID